MSKPPESTIDHLDAIKTAFDIATNIVHVSACANGWWQNRDDIRDACIAVHPSLGRAADANVQIATLGLICSEAGEAIEFIREGDGPDDKLPEYKGVDVELVDVIIRALDLLGKRGAPVGEILVKKLKKNRERGHMHGGKLA